MDKIDFHDNGIEWFLEKEMSRELVSGPMV